MWEILLHFRGECRNALYCIVQCSFHVSVRDACIRQRCALSNVTYALGAPFAIFYSEQIVCEAQIVGKFFKQVDAEAGTALIEATVPTCGRNVHSAIFKRTVTWLSRICFLSTRAITQIFFTQRAMCGSYLSIRNEIFRSEVKYTQCFI